MVFQVNDRDSEYAQLYMLYFHWITRTTSWQYTIQRLTQDVLISFTENLRASFIVLNPAAKETKWHLNRRNVISVVVDVVFVRSGSTVEETGWCSLGCSNAKSMRLVMRIVAPMIWASWKLKYINLGGMTSLYQIGPAPWMRWVCVDVFALK